MKVFLVDIDGTCCDDIMNEDSHLYPTAKVIEGSLEQINKWYEEGNHITFFTAREEKDKEVGCAVGATHAGGGVHVNVRPLAGVIVLSVVTVALFAVPAIVDAQVVEEDLLL